ncbi:extracellular solute-binding protein [Actinotalea subterranea]|uniref:ABC transporter substrate-binding protein n=1 Tax=Actinotalea subterranea TaxID=2607497 RepID=UPI0011ED187F|nr:extracellular solute-binding protein [Actinotalea subterranea]
MRTTRKRALALTAGIAGIALVATGCSSGSDDEGGDDAGSGDSDEKITLTISTFNEWGYEPLLEQYMDENPSITIEHNKFGTSNEARDQFNTSLAAGSGLADVVGIEIDWMTEVMQYSDQFTDLASDSVEGRWQDWKVGQATTPDGKLVGYGTDIGPEGIAYRSDLFAAAGLPTDRAEVAELFGGEDATWDDFFAVGEQFAAASEVPFYDSGAAVYQGMVNQLEAAYETPGTDEVIATENADVKDIYDTIMAHTELSAGLQQWGEDWNNSFQTDGFAVMLAPSWMLGVIEGQAEGVEGWDIADVFPGGGGNWGGSFLTVPAQSKYPEEAKALADWLTAPEQQLVAFQTSGNFPSQVEAQESEEIKAITNEFFNDAPIGEIFATRAAAVTVAPYKGANYFPINDAMAQAINRVEVDGTDDATSSWDKWVAEVEAIG